MSFPNSSHSNSVNRQTLHLELKAYSNMVQAKVNDLWDPYIVTFMFSHIPYEETRRNSMMKSQIEGVYDKLQTRVLRRPLAPSQVEKRPFWLASPDFPVFKHAKQSLADASINGGLHWHALALLPNESRLRRSLECEISEKQDLYAPSPSMLRRVHAQLVEPTDAAYVTSYVLKSVAKGRTAYDDLLILPKSRSELISKPTALNPSLGKRLRRD